jgi:C4-dicarboxylate transporter DctQ subunit
MDAIARVVTKGSEILVVLCMFAITLLVSAETIARYGFDSSFYITNEVCVILLVWIGYVGSSLAIRQGGHAAFEALQGKLGRWFGVERAWILALCNLLVAVFAGFLLVTGIPVTLNAVHEYAPASGISQLWMFVAAPVGACLMLFQLAMLLRANLAQVLAAPGATSGGDPPGGRLTDLRDVY